MHGASERASEAYLLVRLARERVATPQTGPAVVFHEPQIFMRRLIHGNVRAEALPHN